MKKIQEIFLTKPLLTLAFLLLILFVGFLVSPFRLPFFSSFGHSLHVDALPDLSENQQIIHAKWPGRSPEDVENQLTWPLSSQLLGISGVKSVRTWSFQGFSLLYLIFDENTEFYFSRTRILEKLASLDESVLPQGVKPALGPDSTGLGQIYFYLLDGVNELGQRVGGVDLETLRTLQDWTIRPALQGIEGVSEVASIGGHQRQYEVQIDPFRLAFYQISLEKVFRILQSSNLDVGAGTMEYNRVEYLVRGLGFVKNIEDIEKIVIMEKDGKPVFLEDIAVIQMTPTPRRGILDDGGRETVGGVVISRYGKNPLEVIEKIREKVIQINQTLPIITDSSGKKIQVRIFSYYDRGEIVMDTIQTLFKALKEEILIASMVILLFLFHTGASFLLSLVLPLGILASFIFMKLAGIEANIVSLSGIAIAIGVMGDVGIVLIESIQKRMKEGEGTVLQNILEGAHSVSVPILVSVSTTLISFLPVFFLTDAEYKLFSPLAATKTAAILAALIVVLLIFPPLSRLFLHRRLDSLNQKSAMPLFFVCMFFLSRTWLPLGFESGVVKNLLFTFFCISFFLLILFFIWFFYGKILIWILDHKAYFLVVPFFCSIFGFVIWMGFPTLAEVLPKDWKKSSVSVWLSSQFPGLQSEFMPSLEEGSFLFMPTSMPHAGTVEMGDVLSVLDQKIASIPEVEWAVGKAGRDASAMDPAPLSMIETIIQYKPEYILDENNQKKRFRYNDKGFVYENSKLVEDPDGRPFRNWRDHIRTPRDIWDEIIKVTTLPGTTSAPFLQPIEGRIVMLQSGMRAPMGIKIFGDQLEKMEKFAISLEKVLMDVEGIKSQAVFADRIVGKPYLEIEWKRDQLARYGFSVAEVQNWLEWGVGGKVATEILLGRQRFPLTLRFLKEFRDSPEDLEKIVIFNSKGEGIQLGVLANLYYRRGPQAIQGEDNRLVSFVLFDKNEDISATEAVLRAKKTIEQKLDKKEITLEAGMSYQFAGSFINQQRADRSLKVIIPIALFLIFLILSLQFNSVAVTLIIFSSVFVTWSGGFILIWLFAKPWFLDFSVLGFSLRNLFQISQVHLSVAVWVGFLSLFGIATDDGVLISSYIREKIQGEDLSTPQKIRLLVLMAGKKRITACLMTTATTLLALLPIFTSSGRGADIMRPMAVPIFGGMMIELMTLFVVPALYCFYLEWRNHEQT